MRQKYQQHDFIIDNFTQTYQSECREKIKETMVAATEKLPHHKTRLRLKNAKQKMHDFYTDVLGRNIEINQPIFTQSQVESYKQHQILYILWIFFLFVLETYMYSMIGGLVLPSGMRAIGMKLIAGAGMASVFIASLHLSFKFFWEYWDARVLVNTENLDKKELQKFIPNLFISATIFILFLASNIYTGFIRSTLVEGNTNSETVLHSISSELLIFFMLLSLVVACVMAFLEREIAKNGIKIKVYNNWIKQQQERKKYNTNIREMYKSCIDTMHVEVEKYWSLTKDLQRVFIKEVDEKRNELLKELEEAIKNKKVDLNNLNNELYQQYLPIAIMRYELFRYGILSDPFITTTLEKIKDELNAMNDFEKEITDDETLQPDYVIDENNQELQDK